MAGEHLMNLLTEAEQALASLVLPPIDATAPVARPRRWKELQRCADSTHTPQPSASRNAAITLRIELGRTCLSPRELLDLRKGSVVPLDRAVGDSVDIYADQRLAARGELVVVEGNFAVRVVELISQRDNVGCSAAAGTATHGRFQADVPSAAKQKGRRAVGR